MPDALPIGLAAIDWREQLAYWMYRAGAYLILNVLEDPALMALVFC